MGMIRRKLFINISSVLLFSKTINEIGSVEQMVSHPHTHTYIHSSISNLLTIFNIG